MLHSTQERETMPSRFCVAFLTVISFRMAFFRQFSEQKCELFLLSGAEGPAVIELCCSPSSWGQVPLCRKSGSWTILHTFCTPSQHDKFLSLSYSSYVALLLTWKDLFFRVITLSLYYHFLSCISRMGTMSTNIRFMGRMQAVLLKCRNY